MEARAELALLFGTGRLVVWAVAALLVTGVAKAAPIFIAEELLPAQGDVRVEAKSLNSKGQVVGASYSANSDSSAILWSRGEVEVLARADTYATTSVDARGFHANDINDFGQIVGTGWVCQSGFHFCDLGNQTGTWISC